MWSGRPLKDAVDLGFIRTLNERCIDLMVGLARSDQPPIPAAVSANRTLWCGLDPPARECAASHPVLLLDINFTDPAWWRWATESRSVEREASAVSYLPLEIASELMRETINLVWVIARKDQSLAIIFCGMAPQVAHMFSSFSPPDVERISAQYHRHLRLRFDDSPAYWRMHLRTSRSRAVPSAPSLEVPSDILQQSH
jgi:hypothetical protein